MSRKFLKVLTSLALALSLLPVFAGAQPAKAPAPADAAKKKLDPAKEKAIRKLLNLSKADESGDMILEGMIQSLKRSMPSLPESFWKELSREKILKDFEEVLVGIYDRHLTMEEIAAITKFYESPVGKSVLEKMRAISMDSAQAGQEFSATVLRMVMDEAEKKGVLPKPHGH